MLWCGEGWLSVWGHVFAWKRQQRSGVYFFLCDLMTTLPACSEMNHGQVPKQNQTTWNELYSIWVQPISYSSSPFCTRVTFSILVGASPCHIELAHFTCRASPFHIELVNSIQGYCVVYDAGPFHIGLVHHIQF